MTGVSFIDAVATRSGHPVQDVADLLEEAQVPTSDTVGAPHRLRVKRLAFTGEKAGISTGAIDFDQQFGDGLWALTTEKNERGKTSVLEILMWAIRGQPKRLQGDVQAWLHTVVLEGTVDEEKFVVEFELADGEPAGTLTFRGEKRPFSSEAAFTHTMSTFMMEQLGLDSFPQWVRDKGVSTHGWPLFSTVLYMPHGTHQAVIGDEATAGLPQRLVQLFVGVPWARTSISCQAALKQAQAKASEQHDSKQAFQEAASQMLDLRQQDLADAKLELAELPEGLPNEEQLEDARSEWLDLMDRHGKAESQQREAKRDANAACEEAARWKKQLTDMTEAAIAEELFQGLDPSACPRCLTPIGVERKQAEVDTQACAVCSHQIDLGLHMEIDSTESGSEGDEAGSVEELRRLVDKAEQAAAEEQARFEDLSAHADSLTQELAGAKSSVDAHAGQMAQVQHRRTLETKIMALEAVIADMGSLAADDTAAASHDPSLEARIQVFKAAEKEARERVRSDSAELMVQINQAILDLARRFGLENLQSVELNFAANLKLAKGGVGDSFSKQTPGEKLRLRIAVIVALLRVAHQSKIGRHPGLLLIDSVGAEETEPADLASFMRELSAVAAETGIEIIVASARPEILEYVPEEHRVSAEGEDYLW